MCKTKPIPGSGLAGAGPAGQAPWGSSLDPRPYGLRPPRIGRTNKANFLGCLEMGADRQDRREANVQNKANSTIADCGFWIADSGSLRPAARAARGRLYKQTQLGWSGEAPEGEMRKTNRIWSGRPGTGAGGRETPPARDCAKQSQRAVVGGQLSVVGWRTAAPNKANLLRVKTQDKCFAEKELW